MSNVKKCHSCRVVKSFECFHKGTGKHKLHSHCNICRKLSAHGLAPHQIEVKEELNEKV